MYEVTQYIRSNTEKENMPQLDSPSSYVVAFGKGSIINYYFSYKALRRNTIYIVALPGGV